MADRNDDLVSAEERAAEQEAGNIGGHAPEENLPPEERPLAEAGAGESEGFELAEQELIEHASHGDEHNPQAILTQSEGIVEEEGEQGVFSEPDEVDPTEVVDDPDEPDGPGAGPGIAAER